MESADVVLLFVDIVKLAIPFAFIFWVCEMITTMFVRAAFGGRLSFKVN